MIKIEWTNDSDLASEIIKSIYEYVSDDTSPKKEDYRLDIDDLARFALCYYDDVMMGGFCVFMKANSAEIHTCLLPTAKGKARDFGRAILEKIFNETDVEKVTSYAPIDNPKAIKLAIDCGMSDTGYGEPMMKNGKPVNVKNLEIIRGRLCQ